MDWQQAYASDDTPWDLRQVTPPLAALLASPAPATWGIAERSRVAVPGCGRGHDLRAWARAGHRVTGFDVAPEAVREARTLLRLNRVDGVDVLCRDALEPGPEHIGAFDVVYDYTCLCALAPGLRSRYGGAVAALLRPGGVWLGLVYPLAPAGHAERPPYRLDAAAVTAALGAGFERVAERDPEHSVPRRRGHERWFVHRRR
ncbi:MAG: methyltransferase domain-containing protein [Planctomycetes bacterium]|nr:methyltransferase domain-containing protein [Planctomycetota bacterium]